MEFEDNKKYCPNCGEESLGIEDGFGKCENKECDFGGKVKECENYCGNVMDEDDEEFICAECFNRTVNRKD